MYIIGNREKLEQFFGYINLETERKSLDGIDVVIERLQVAANVMQELQAEGVVFFEDAADAREYLVQNWEQPEYPILNATESSQPDEENL